MSFDALKKQVNNLTLYDVKAGVRKVQNGMLRYVIAVYPWPKMNRGFANGLCSAVMNYTEMESKVFIAITVPASNVIRAFPSA